MASDLEDFADSLLIEGRFYNEHDQDLFRERTGTVSQSDFAILLDEFDILKDQVNYVPMDVSALTISPSLVEVGSVIPSITLNWTRNKDAVSQSFNQGIGIIDPVVTSLVRSVSLTSSTAYTLTADDGTTNTGHSDSVSATINFQHKAYWGISAAASLDSAGILALVNNAFGTSRVRSFVLNGSGQYLYYAYPAGWGDAVFTVDGFVNNAWHKVPGGIPMNFTKANGNVTPYNVYRSDTIQNGDNIQISVN